MNAAVEAIGMYSPNSPEYPVGIDSERTERRLGQTYGNGSQRARGLGLSWFRIGENPRSRQPQNHETVHHELVSAAKFQYYDGCQVGLPAGYPKWVSEKSSIRDK